MKLIAIVLLILLVWLQYKIWLQDGGIPEVIELRDEVENTRQEVETLKQRNQSLEAEVVDLKKGLDAIEERARSEMGMIKKGEVYYQVIDREQEDGASAQEASPVPAVQEKDDADSTVKHTEAEHVETRQPDDQQSSGASVSLPDNIIRR